MSRNGAKKISCLVVLGLCGLFPAFSRAESSVSGQLVPTLLDASTYGTEIFKIILYLGCLVGGLLVLRAVMRRPWLSRSRQPHHKPIRVVAQQFLDQRKSLIIVEVEGHRLLLASAADRLDMLLELRSEADLTADGEGSPEGNPSPFLPGEQKFNATTV